MSEEQQQVEEQQEHPEEELDLRAQLEQTVAEFEENEVQRLEADDTGPAENAPDAPGEATLPDGTDAPPAEGDVPAPTDAHLSEEAYPDDAEKYPNLTAERVGKAPATWRPNAREGWSDLPPSVQREIHRREADYNRVVQDASEQRRTAEGFDAVVRPFESLILAQGIQDPMEAVKGLLGTAAELQTGTPQQKANRLAQMVNHYDVDLRMLDQALTAVIQGTAPAQDPMQRMIEEQTAPLREKLDAITGRIQQASEQENARADEQLRTFAEKVEFFEDVRLDMADLLSQADARGREMSLQEAYDLACQMNPQVKTVLTAREQKAQELAEQQRLDAEKAELQRKQRLAGSSLHAPRSGTTPPPPSNGSIREDIMAAMERLEDRR